MDFRVPKLIADAGQSGERAQALHLSCGSLARNQNGGWHDFRHTQGTTLRKHGWSAKVRADILGHSSLQVTDGVYDTRTKTISAKRSPELPLSCYEMLRNHKSQIRKFLKTKGLVPVVGLEPTT